MQESKVGHKNVRKAQEHKVRHKQESKVGFQKVRYTDKKLGKIFPICGEGIRCKAIQRKDFPDFFPKYGKNGPCLKDCMAQALVLLLGVTKKN